MPGTPSQNIQEIIEKRARRQTVLEQTLSLLDRAEEKRRTDRENRRRWNRVLTRLEDSFIEAKQSVAECDTLIEIERKRAQQPSEKPEEKGEPAPIAASSAQDNVDPEARAAFRIVETPMENLSDVALEEVALARAYTERSAFQAHDGQFRTKLSAKLELASQLPDESAVSSEKEERRHQHVLRDAIEKLITKRFDVMTGDEIQLILSCYTVLSTKLVPTASNKRLADLISRTITKLRAESERRLLSPR